MPVRNQRTNHNQHHHTNGIAHNGHTAQDEFIDSLQDSNGTGTSDRIDPLRFFPYYGLNLEQRQGTAQAVADCPFCAKEAKLYVGLEDLDSKHYKGGWECKSCNAKGNAHSFIQRLWEVSKAATLESQYMALAEERGLLYYDTLARWGCALSILTGEWIIPAYNAAGKVNQLYRYINAQGKDGKWRKVLMGGPGLNPGLFNGAALSGKAGEKVKFVHVSEGPWDGMALEEIMLRTKEGVDGSLSTTATAGLSLLGKSCVVAVPGANVWRANWCSLLGNKSVRLYYDNDHLRINADNGQKAEGAGSLGVKRVVSALANAATPAEEVHYVCWSGNAEQQWNEDLPNGYDLRDLFSQEGDLRGRVGVLESLQRLLTPVPGEWVQQDKNAKSGKIVLEPIPCESWQKLDNAWRKAMKWTEDLRGALLCMFSVTCAVPIMGEKLWMKIVGPPSCGKTTLCEAISVARNFVLPKDTFSGITSGYQVDKEGSENLSLLLKIDGKTLAIKDADTILQHPNKGQILSQFRGLFDGAFRVQYNNKMSMDQDNINTGVILCGTSSLRVLDDSELGQRFLDYEIMSGVNLQLENEINCRSLNHFRHMMSESPLCNGEGSDTPEKTYAKRLTGGYVEYLRKNIERLIKRVEMEDTALEHCNSCGKFVAYFRSRPSGKQSEEVHRELSTRLVLQTAKLAYALAAVLGKNSVDKEIQERLRRVALNTARGRTLDIGRYLYIVGEDGAETKALAVYLGDTEDKVRALLRFLKRIGVVTQFEYYGNDGLGQKRWRWRLTETVKTLYAHLMDPNGQVAARYSSETGDSPVHAVPKVKDDDLSDNESP